METFDTLLRKARAEQEQQDRTQAAAARAAAEALRDQETILRLCDAPSEAGTKRPAAIYLDAAAVLRRRDERDRLEKYGREITGGYTHYEAERRCVVALLQDACDGKAATTIGRKFQAARKVFGVARLQSAALRVAERFARPEPAAPPAEPESAPPVPAKPAALPKTPSESAPPYNGPLSNPDTPARWAKKFQMSSKTFKRHVLRGKIRAKILSDRSYQIAVGDIPQQNAPPLSGHK
jgi:hypothetical protein